MQVFECSKKYFLCGILRVFHRAQQTPGQRQHSTLVPNYDLLEGGGISGCCAGE
jgi:hypothetical protein